MCSSRRTISVLTSCETAAVPPSTMSLQCTFPHVKAPVSPRPTAETPTLLGTQTHALPPLVSAVRVFSIGPLSHPRYFLRLLRLTLACVSCEIGSSAGMARVSPRSSRREAGFARQFGTAQGQLPRQRGADALFRARVFFKRPAPADSPRRSKPARTSLNRWRTGWRIAAPALFRSRRVARNHRCIRPNPGGNPYGAG